MDDWQSKVSKILKFVRQLNSILSTTVDAPAIALRLFLLAAQIADECGFENLTYDMYVDAFSVYEESISESRAQLQAITLIIGTLQGARVFSEDNYDTLITKAALHGAKLLKKPHQASAVNLASHLWWQEIPPEEEPAEAPKEAEKASTKEEGEGAKAVCIRTITCNLSVLTCWLSVPAPGQQARAGMPAESTSHCQLRHRGDRHYPAVLRHARPVPVLPRSRCPCCKSLMACARMQWLTQCCCNRSLQSLSTASSSSSPRQSTASHLRTSTPRSGRRRGCSRVYRPPR